MSVARPFLYKVTMYHNLETVIKIVLINEPTGYKSSESQETIRKFFDSLCWVVSSIEQIDFTSDQVIEII